MRSQCLPGGIYVARPEEGAVALHAGIAVAVQGEWPFVGPVELGPLPVEPIADEAGRDVQRVALIRPPTVDAERECLSVRVPVTACFLFVKSFHRTGVAHGAA